MKKLIKMLAVTALCVFMVGLGMTLADKQTLTEGTVRLHVIAESDSPEDQAVKLKVRDAVLEKLDGLLSGSEDADDAKAVIRGSLEELEAAANEALRAAGSGLTAAVDLCREAYPVRHYDTFSLPSGVYDSLQVTIGSGQGQNWWCVVFPSLCVGAASEDVRSAAASAGFSDSLTDTITEPEEYEISFFFLDCLGKVENFFFHG